MPLLGRLAALVVMLLTAAAPALGAGSAAQQLADKYVPVVMLKKQMALHKIHLPPHLHHIHG